MYEPHKNPKNPIPYNGPSFDSSITDASFRLLVESVRDYGIFIMDRLGYIKTWNAGAERLKGYSADEIINQHFSVFYTHPDIERDHPRTELEIAAREGRYEEEGWRIRKDGSRFWANVVITALKDKDSRVIGFAKVTRDLTERKQAELNLKCSEERFRKMFEDVKDYAMIFLDTKGYVLSWNEGARRIKGYELKDIIGSHFSKFYSEHDIQMGKCEYELKEATDTGRFEEEGWRLRKDNTKFWANVLITPIKDDLGKLIGFSLVTRDMTDRKRAEDILKMSYASLEKRVDERTKELTEANARLKEAVQIRDEFLSIASHELRTPLTPLKLQVQTLLYNLENHNTDFLSEERLQKLASICDRSVTRLSILIDNLLDVSRINSGKFVLNFETIDYSELIRDIIERYKSEIAKVGYKLTIKPDAPILGSADRLRVEQIIVNLITNALKYGRGEAIEVELSRDSSNVIFRVKDRGIGISPGDQARVFERFERIENHSNILGLGLGLYIVRQVVEAHKGRISVESKLNEGSTFTVILPIAES